MAFEVIYFPVYLHNLGPTELWVLFLYCQGLEVSRILIPLVRSRLMPVMRDVIIIRVPAGKMDESAVKGYQTSPLFCAGK